jgi:hypothetical protein
MPITIRDWHSGEYMSSTPRSPWVTAPIVLGLFFGGGYLGGLLANSLAPHSVIAEFVGFFAFPVSFFIGIMGWLGTAVIGALPKLVRLNRHKDRSSGQGKGLAGSAIPPGSFAFVPAALIPCTLCGLVVGALSTTLSFIVVVFLYFVLGLGYGAACWKLARSGFLPFPEE